MKISTKVNIFIVTCFLLILTAFTLLTRGLGGRYYIYKYKKKLDKASKNLNIKEGDITIQRFTYYSDLEELNNEIMTKNFKGDSWKYKIWFDRDAIKKLNKKDIVTKLYYQDQLKSAFLVRLIKRDNNYYSLRVAIPSIKENLDTALELVVIILTLVMLIALIISLLFFQKINTSITLFKSNLNYLSNREFSNIISMSSSDEFSDISATIKNISLELDKQFISLEGNLKREKKFLRNLSHELKTPITIAFGYIEILKEEIQNPRLEYIESELLRMSKLLKRFEGLSINPKYIFKESVRVDKVIEELGKRFSLDNPNIKYIESLSPFKTFGDIELLESCLYNLYSNAFSYTKDEVIVSIKSIKDHTILSITNNGLEISREDASKVWEPFYRCNNSSSKYGGSGLGLSIVKEIIEVHKWIIDLETKDQSTTFSIIFPLESKVSPADS